jgi:hypothetical protein
VLRHELHGLNAVGTTAETSVAFRSAKEGGFRGAKGDNPTDIDLPVLSEHGTHKSPSD